MAGFFKAPFGRTLIHPFFLFCSLAFIFHQVSQKILHLRLDWIDAYLDNLMCMPILLTGLLAEQRQKRAELLYTLPLLEVVVIVLVLSILFEVFFPRWSDGFTADYWDVAAYAAGGFLFYHIVNRGKQSCPCSKRIIFPQEKFPN